MENNQNWLAILLDEAGMSPADLERAAGVDSSVISNVINGKKGIGMSLAQKFGKALNLDPGDILRAAGVWDSNNDEDRLDKQIKNIAKKFPIEEKKKIVKRLKLEASLYEDKRPTRP
jgi:plasmid maintenance system antidote protein VapI